MVREVRRLKAKADVKAGGAPSMKKTYGQVTKERERVAGVERKQSATTRSAEQVTQGRAMLARSMRLRPVEAKVPEVAARKRTAGTSRRLKPRPASSRKAK